uniref:helix-turn-helix domain-containing protein n=1 Tax=Alistipes sp. TaxID=1872444 RepID=UPI0040565A48
MEKREIPEISISKMHQGREIKGCVFHNGCFIADLSGASQERMAIGFPCRINNFFISVVRNGHEKVAVNMVEHHISGPSVFINIPNNIIDFTNISSKEPISGCVISFDEEFLKGIDVDIKHLFPLFIATRKQPVLQLEEEECEELISAIYEIKKEITHTKREPFEQEIIQSYFVILLYRLGQIIRRREEELPAMENSAKSRNEEYLERFIKLLAANYKQERTLAFYASELCITPKYLTTLIKRISGRSASEWIDSCVIMEAKNLLRYSTMSIQEIAYALNFPNQSFFGKYFKHQTGYSPSAYKMLK